MVELCLSFIKAKLAEWGKMPIIRSYLVGFEYSYNTQRAD